MNSISHFGPGTYVALTTGSSTIAFSQPIFGSSHYTIHNNGLRDLALHLGMAKHVDRQSEIAGSLQTIVRTLTNSANQQQKQAIQAAATTLQQFIRQTTTATTTVYIPDFSFDEGLRILQITLNRQGQNNNDVAIQFSWEGKPEDAGYYFLNYNYPNQPISLSTLIQAQENVSIESLFAD